MRVGFVADVHSNLHAFQAVLAHFGKVPDLAPASAMKGACSCGLAHVTLDRLYHVGDLVGYGAHPKEVVALARDATLGGVLGNHDWAALRDGYVPFNPSAYAGLEHTRRELGDGDRKVLGGLPLRIDLDLDGMDLALVHGSPADPLWEYVFPEEAPRVLEQFGSAPPRAVETRPRTLVLGHTHVPILRTVAPVVAAGVQRKGPRPVALPKVPYASALVNPGSVGQPRDDDPRASCAILDTETGSVVHHRVPYDLHGAARAIRDVGLPVELGERLFYGR